MLNIIKADFYKLFKSKTFWIVLLVAFLFASLMLVATYFGLQSMGEAGGPPPEALAQNLKDLFLSGLQSGIVQMLVAVGVTIFITTEYTSGIIKDTTSSHRSRVQIFLSKIITSSVASILILVFYSLYQTLMGSMFLEYGAAFTLNELLILFKAFLSASVAIIALSTLFATISTLLKSTGASLGLNIGILMFGKLIFFLISLIHDFVKNIGDFWIINALEKIIYQSSISVFELKSWLVVVTYFALSLIIGLKVFKTQDIK